MRSLSLTLCGWLLAAQTLWAAGDRDVAVLFAAGAFGEAQTRSEVAWRRAQGVGDLLASAVAAANVGATLTMLGQFDDAQMWQARASKILTSERQKTLLGRLAVAQAVTAFLQSRRYSTPPPEDALSHLSRAAALLGARDLRLRVVEAEVLGQSMDPDQAQRGYMAYRALIAQHVERGDSLSVARFVARQSRLDGDSGGHRDALAGYLRAAAIFRAEGLLGETALALRNAGHAQRKLGAYDDSARLLDEALKMAEDAPLQALIWNDMSRLYAEMGQLERAMQCDAEADDLLDTIAAAIPRGQAADSVLLRFQHLLLLRFASLLPYDVDLFPGFYDQLLLTLPVGETR